jgi:anti-sigma regulatory factor (Ser/Thr protein kinase)
MLAKDDIINKEIELPAVMDNFNGFMNFIESNLTIAGVGKIIADKITTASEEIITNIINYAYSASGGSLKIDFNYKPGRITVIFIDEGARFNPLDSPDVNVALPLEKREAGGLGIFLAKNLMDGMSYEYKEGKNHLSLVKFIS